MPSNHLILCRPLLLSSSVFPSIRVFSMSQLFPSGGQSIGASASASVLPMNFQGWFPLGWTGLTSLLSMGLSRVFSSTTVGDLCSQVSPGRQEHGPLLDATGIATDCFSFLVYHSSREVPRWPAEVGPLESRVHCLNVFGLFCFVLWNPWKHHILASIAYRCLWKGMVFFSNWMIEERQLCPLTPGGPSTGARTPEGQRPPSGLPATCSPPARHVPRPGCQVCVLRPLPGLFHVLTSP